MKQKCPNNNAVSILPQALSLRKEEERGEEKYRIKKL
jgi:hypothetical protein